MTELTELDALRVRFSQRETSDLLRLWIEHDEQEWRPEVFPIIASVLQERGETLPEHGGTRGAELRHQRKLEQRDRKQADADLVRVRVANAFAAWLGGVLVLFATGGFVQTIDSIIPESRWPDFSGHRYLQTFVAAIFLSIFGFFWRLAASFVWRIIAGRRNSVRLSNHDPFAG